MFLGSRFFPTVWLSIPLFTLTFFATLSAQALEQTVPKNALVFVPLKGNISEAQFFILRRALKAAERAEARGIVLNMDTYGGELAAAVKILNLLLETKLPTYTWVNTNAGSAGALIALGTKYIYMAPVSAIGAAAPVLGGGQDVPETLNAKIVSYYSGYFRSAAERNGYNPDLAVAFINKEKEVKIGERVICEKGELLTLSAQEAVRKYDGKPLLASGIAQNMTQLADEAGLGDAVLFEWKPSGFETVAKWITTLAPLFLLGGIIGAYIEFKSPGFGVPGLVSALCFLLFFAGHYIAGLTGYEAIVLFVFGLLLVLFELALFPGILFISAIGILCMLGAILFAMVDYWPSRTLQLDFETFGTALMNFFLTIIFAAVAISLLARFLPSIPLLQGLFLRAATPSGPALSPAPLSLARSSVQPGDEGIAITDLRPSGRARFGELLADVITEGYFVPAGSTVRAVRRQGAEMLVELAEPGETDRPKA
jgi:membrane-bound serine protease (ClpP class)